MLFPFLLLLLLLDCGHVRLLLLNSPVESSYGLQLFTLFHQSTGAASGRGQQGKRPERRKLLQVCVFLSLAKGQARDLVVLTFSPRKIKIKYIVNQLYNY